MADDILIQPVSNTKDLKDFINFPFSLYKNDPNWVPPLISSLKKTLNPERNPFFKHSDFQYFLAKSSDNVVGRVAAVIDYNHNEFQSEKTGFIGYFECVDNYDTAKKLFDHSIAWLKERKMEIARGPVNLSPNNELGLLIDSFDSPPVLMMTYNPEYYIDFFTRYGFTKTMDLYAYYRNGEKFPELLVKIAESVRQKNKITLRNVDMKDFNSEVEVVKKIYNAAWEKNWGFVPWTDEEFDFLAEDLKQVIDPDLVFIAESDGKPVGFSLTLPNINQALIKINGRLTPINLLKLLWYSRKIDHVRVVSLGILKEFRRTGLAALLYYETYRKAMNKGIKSGEMSWILENNLAMNRDLERMGAEIYKTYRVYDKEIS